MPASLLARDITLSLGNRFILDGVDIAVDPGHRIGLVGPNGVGKTTLLRILAGELRPERGTVRLAPLDANVGHLVQEPERGDETVSEHVARRTQVSSATAALDAATVDLAAGVDGADDRYAHALERWLALGAADFDSRLADAWADLGLGESLLHQPMPSLSGGEAARVGLAVMLLARFDLFLLDEPTNDLDLDGLARLERFVTGLGAGVVIVSHDRTFLERTVTDVVELDEFTRSATHYAGGWTAYLAERAAAQARAVEAWEEYDTKRSTLVARAQREREWASQGLSRAKKKPDDNDKFVRNWKINQTEQLAGRAARTERAMQRLDVVEQPREPWQLRLSVASAERSGDVVARLESCGRRARFVHPWSGRSGGRLRRAGGDRRRQRFGQVDAARRAARRDPAHVGHAVARPGRGRRPVGATAWAVPGPNDGARRVPRRDRTDDQ